MLARAGLGRTVPRAGLLLMIAANAPDIDVLWSWPGGTANYLEHHRGVTHALAFSPLIAILPVAIVWAAGRRTTPWFRFWIWSWIGVLSHLALDWTNVYGIRLYLPFSSDWLRLDVTNVIDLLIWAILLLGVLAPALSRLVSSEIGAKSGSGRGWAAFILVLLAGYELLRFNEHDQAIRILESRIYDGAAPIRVAAFAVNANPRIWRGVVETSTGFIVYQMNLAEEFDPFAGRTFYKPAFSPAMNAAAQTRPFRALVGFSNWLIWRSTPAPGAEGTQVELFDLRFGTPSAPGLSATATVLANGQVESAQAGFGPLLR